MLRSDEPIRTKRTHKRLFFKGMNGGYLRLDTRQDSPWSSGVLYAPSGDPADDACPWGPVENFEEESPFLDVVDIKEKAEREQFQRHIQEELGDNELFGLF
jgi:hypothetical protein